MPAPSSPVVAGSLGERLRLARKRRGWSQWDLASAARMSQRAVSMLEVGDRGEHIGASTLYQLAAALRVRMEDLLGLPPLGPRP